MNIRKWIYFFFVGLRGQPLGKYYKGFLHEYQTGISPDTTEKFLVKLFQHSEQNVPYYAKLMKNIGSSYRNDPIEYLQHFPVLTKDLIRRHFDELKSSDLPQRKWYLNSSGGSTGEPVQLIQDREYAAQAGAVKLLYSKLVGREIGECEIMLWGNIHDIVSSSEGCQAQLINRLDNVIFVNSQLMTAARMREYVNILNRSEAKLIVAYADSIFEIAKYVEREGLFVRPQSAIMTSAFNLYPFMRSKIEEIFKCRVFDRYGSREVGDIACEIPGITGLWVAPWGNYLEIVDQDGNIVPAGMEGEILVTSLRNYAMPLIRYKIGDRGVLSNASNKNLQVLKELTGRSMDLFITREGSLINPGYFMANLYFRDWIGRYQVIQKDYSKVIYRIIKVADPPAIELEEIIAVTKNVMGDDCNVIIEFVDVIQTAPSGKFRFLSSEISR
jgi:phenylacetate-CoA ligase